MAEKIYRAYATEISTYTEHWGRATSRLPAKMVDFNTAVSPDDTSGWGYTYAQLKLNSSDKNVPKENIYVRGISGWKAPYNTNHNTVWDGTGTLINNFGFLTGNENLTMVRFRVHYNYTSFHWMFLRLFKNDSAISDYMLYTMGVGSTVSNYRTSGRFITGTDAQTYFPEYIPFYRSKSGTENTYMTFRKAADGVFYMEDADGNLHTDVPDIGRITLTDIMNGNYNIELSTQFKPDYTYSSSYYDEIMLLRMDIGIDEEPTSKIYVGNKRATGLYVGNKQAQAYLGTTRII